MDCPKFTDDYETILEWGKVAVKYDDGDDPHIGEWNGQPITKKVMDDLSSTP